MATELFDIYEYRAALLEWQQEKVGQTQRIYLANDSSTLLQNMTEDILRYGNLLYNRFATTLDAVDLSDIQHHYAAGDPLRKRWHHEDLQKLLHDLIREKQDSLAQYGRYQSILGEWHDMMEWLNTLLPGENHALISIEDSVPNFVRRLFEKYFDATTLYQRNQSPQDVAWMGKLALLYLGGAWWNQSDGLHFLHQLVAEHNELFEFY